MAGKKVTFTIPEPPKDASPQMRQMLAAMKEAVEVRLGRRGDPLEEGVTRRDLLEGGIARLGGQGNGQLVPVTVESAEARIIPPMPVALGAEGVFGGISLTWDTPYQQYNVHAFAEIWRSDKPDPTTRVLLDSSRGQLYFDRIPDSNATKYYYWVRFLSEYNREGPFSNVVSATKQADVAELMADISGHIDEGDLSASFRGTVNGMKTSITQTSQVVEGLKAQYTVRLDVNGYISGFGSYNNGTTSEFAILADTFWVASPGSTGKIKPFILYNNVLYLDAAVIRDGTIQQGKLGPISFGKLVDGAGNPVTTVAGRLRVDMIDVNSIQITDANIAGVIRSNQVASNGQPRWILDKNGGMAMNSSNGNGRFEMRDNVMKFFDNARLRIQLGDQTL
ncbi:hypothetical protein NL64_06110 [Pseudomonas fluorescens]|uniref:phage tail tip fiber protein n=1 Tax=Pseudomonas fluorescens TaxID=294 RepID=UPI00054C08A2|nr:DUF1983 domain-containing protein [Pseudomonas fluorescens]KII34837.1 hypothetical protein NL64_06110 [Pseudomonas fluorescens]